MPLTWTAGLRVDEGWKVSSFHLASASEDEDLHGLDQAQWSVAGSSEASGRSSSSLSIASARSALCPPGIGPAPSTPPRRSCLPCLRLVTAPTRWSTSTSRSVRRERSQCATADERAVAGPEGAGVGDL